MNPDNALGKYVNTFFVLPSTMFYHAFVEGYKSTQTAR